MYCIDFFNKFILKCGELEFIEFFQVRFRDLCQGGDLEMLVLIVSGKVEVEGNSCVFVCSDVTPVCQKSLPECLCGLAYIE